MADFDEGFIEAAKPDGIWQTLILASAIPPEERHIEILSYEVLTYFRLICAGVFAKKKNLVMITRFQTVDKLYKIRASQHFIFI
ncbi:hypothetical protein J7I80_22875 [Bacillus sp. ISL-41]|uniref:hypothetical protein n=1 Tax=Bacillus sp. ISL-41 TaxID=2819127 RepID=UPI001BE73575|nr:hypothetical protein [Bacillus sp. ISL-41]MBT2645069.1 hypothetical protein [Bacillus sp. ISL-41]